MPKEDTTLIEFALGILDQATCQEVEHSLSTSPEARAELRAIEEALSSLALAQEPVRPSGRVRSQLLAALDAPNPSVRFAGFVERLATFFDLGVERIHELLEAVGVVSQAAWVPSGLPGVSLFHLDGGPQVASADCGLVQVESGHSFPLHLHLGDEQALVLHGRCQEDSGLISEPGDILYKPQGSQHSFRVISEEPFVFAVVLHHGFEVVRP